MHTADRDQLAQALRMPRGELQADQRAVRITDEGFQHVDAERVQQQRKRVGLVGGVDRRIDAAIGADVVEREDPQVRRIQRAAGIQQAFGPAGIAIQCVRGHVPMRGNAAGHEDHRRACGAGQFVGDAQLAGAGVAGGEHCVDGAAAGVEHIRRHCSRRAHRFAARG
jgi:hypothetical protein